MHYNYIISIAFILISISLLLNIIFMNSLKKQSYLRLQTIRKTIDDDEVLSKKHQNTLSDLSQLEVSNTKQFLKIKQEIVDVDFTYKELLQLLITKSLL